MAFYKPVNAKCTLISVASLPFRSAFFLFRLQAHLKRLTKTFKPLVYNKWQFAEMSLSITNKEVTIAQVGKFLQAVSAIRVNYFLLLFFIMAFQ